MEKTIVEWIDEHGLDATPRREGEIMEEQTEEHQLEYTPRKEI